MISCIKESSGKWENMINIKQPNCPLEAAQLLELVYGLELIEIISRRNKEYLIYKYVCFSLANMESYKPAKSCMDERSFLASIPSNPGPITSTLAPPSPPSDAQCNCYLCDTNPDKPASDAISRIRISSNTISPPNVNTKSAF